MGCHRGAGRVSQRHFPNIAISSGGGRLWPQATPHYPLFPIGGLRVCVSVCVSVCVFSVGLSMGSWGGECVVAGVDLLGYHPR